MDIDYVEVLEWGAHKKCVRVYYNNGNWAQIAGADSDGTITWLSNSQVQAVLTLLKVDPGFVKRKVEELQSNCIRIRFSP